MAGKHCDEKGWLAASDNKTSKIWNYCKINKDEPGKVRCNLCGCVFKTGTSTSSFTNHLINVHKINFDDVNSSKNPIQSRIFPWFKLSNKSDSIEKVISRLAALDNISFKVIAESKDIQLGLVSQEYKSIPKNRQSVSCLVNAFAQNIIVGIKNETKTRLLQGERFSLTLDEYTSSRNRKYLGVTLHYNTGEYYCLGVVRIYIDSNAQGIENLLRLKLKEYDINLDKDIAALTTDGASVMLKLGRNKSTIHLQCQAHGIHLAVLDLLYKKVQILII